MRNLALFLGTGICCFLVAAFIRGQRVPVSNMLLFAVPATAVWVGLEWMARRKKRRQG